MPYMSLIAVVLCLLNLVYIARVESDITEIRDEIYDVRRAVSNISMDYDNSDVIRAIEDAESNIRRNIIIWSN